MNVETYNPGDIVLWTRKLGSSYANQVHEAEVWYRAKTKIAIKVKLPSGEIVVKYAMPEMLKKRKEQ